jgi:hypothetical protein
VSHIKPQEAARAQRLSCSRSAVGSKIRRTPARRREHRERHTPHAPRFAQAAATSPDKGYRISGPESSMSPEQIAELKPRDRLMSRLLRKAEFVRHTAHGVVIRWEGEREEGELYGLSDPILKSLTFYGHWDPGERPWFDAKIKSVRSRRTTGKSRGRERRRSTRRGSRRDSRR